MASDAEMVRQRIQKACVQADREVTFCLYPHCECRPSLDIIGAAIEAAVAEKAACIFAIAYPVNGQVEMTREQRIADAGNRLDQIVELTKPAAAIRGGSHGE